MQKKKKFTKRGLKPFFCVLPCILIVVLFNYVPLWGWIYSFFNYKPGWELKNCEFVGLQNFRDLFGNRVMLQNILRVLRNTFGIKFLAYAFTPLPMVVAVLLSEVRSRKFQKTVQTLTTIPNFVSWVIMYGLASAFFSHNGAINTFLSNMGMETIGNILHSDKHVWLTQVLLSEWKGLGWQTIVYFAAIAGLDQEIYEAAGIDGAGKMQRIRYITLPQLVPTYFVLLVMSIGNFLNSGIDQYMNFGNALNKEYIEVLDLYVYNLGIGGGMISYSVAVGMLKSVVAIVLFATANYASKKIRGSSVF